MPEPTKVTLGWLADLLGRRMWWAVAGGAAFVILTFAANGLSWTSVIVTVLVVFFLTAFLLLAETFRRLFAGMSEREKP